MGHGLELGGLGCLDHGRERVLGGDAALEEAARALWEQRRGDGPGADHALVGEKCRAARGQVHDAVLAHEAAEAGGMAILGEPNDLHDGASLVSDAREIIAPQASGHHPGTRRGAPVILPSATRSSPERAPPPPKRTRRTGSTWASSGC